MNVPGELDLELPRCSSLRCGKIARTGSMSTPVGLRGGAEANR